MPSKIPQLAADNEASLTIPNLVQYRNDLTLSEDEMEQDPTGSITNSYEEIYRDYEIYVEPNRDPYREGFEWSACKDATEHDSGLSFSIADALADARKAVDKLVD